MEMELHLEVTVCSKFEKIRQFCHLHKYYHVLSSSVRYYLFVLSVNAHSLCSAKITCTKAQPKFKDTPASKSAMAPSTNSSHRIASNSCQLTASNLAVHASKCIIHPSIGAIDVSGQELTRYILAPSEDTPFERFLKEENKLHRLASSPWLSRVNKL